MIFFNLVYKIKKAKTENIRNCSSKGRRNTLITIISIFYYNETSQWGVDDVMTFL